MICKKLAGFMIESQIASAYCSLVTYSEIYDDGTDTAERMLHFLEQVYLLEYGQTLDLKKAVSILDESPNPRGAGRKPIPLRIRNKAQRMRAEGIDVDTIANECGISKRSIYRIT